MSLTNVNLDVCHELLIIKSVTLRRWFYWPHALTEFKEQLNKPYRKSPLNTPKRFCEGMSFLIQHVKTRCFKRGYLALFGSPNIFSEKQRDLENFWTNQKTGIQSAFFFKHEGQMINNNIFTSKQHSITYWRFL